MRCAPASIVCMYALFICATAVVRADVIFDNGTPAADSPAYPMTQSVQAEDFTLTEATFITGIRFYGLEHNGGFTGSIYWSIREDQAGNPALSDIASDTTSSVSTTLTGVIREDFHNAPQAIYGIDMTPVPLDAGHYWLLLHNGPLSNVSTDNAQGFLLWEGSAAVQGTKGLFDAAPFDGGWSEAFGDRAFCLIGVPEPGSTCWAIVLGMLVRRIGRGRKSCRRHV